MENQRLFLFLALALVILAIFNAWDTQQTAPVSAPVATAPQVTDTPTAPTASDAPLVVDTPRETVKVAEPAALNTGNRIHVKTDLLDVELDTAGGDVRRVLLPTYPVSLDDPTNPVRLFNDAPEDMFVAQSGLLGTPGQAPDHHAPFTAETTNYSMTPGTDTLDVRLTWRSPEGVQVVKTYTFHRNSYLIDLSYSVTNGSGQPWSGRLYRQLQRTIPPSTSRFIYTYSGGVVSTPENPYTKVDFDDMATWKPEQPTTKGGWAAMLQHYFLGAWIPDPEESHNYYTRALDGGRYLIGLTSSEQTVAPGASGSFTSRLYVGPKEQARLEEAAPNLRLTVDYGMLDIMAKPLFWLLNASYGVVHNWGVAIILITLMIKLVFYKLSETSYRSMANMRRLQPKLAALKERYGDDRQRFSQAMMTLYKEEKINPLGGCLPVIVQIPVFLALYWVLLESVELRQAAFIPMWIDDLSTKDPFYVLPVLMGISMYFQQKLNPAPMDPIQAKVLGFLPWIFTLFFAFFPSGLVLYWVANNVLSIGQQWFITRRIEAAAAAK